ncbi:MAG TPA: 30S ribosomal protein S12 methylthiotransferase RimO [Spirochaetota bacterium]|nr:30S ribosomal protein S12 methylthiotransferase RimO [Spirochaetota bacterium]HPR48277.1 30S ribosomal protein S12 methylthiotransferase RimO [Spirochaetota bacterium]
MFNPLDISYYVISLGCSKNLVDSEKINASMIAAGFSQSESSDEADIIIINTCGFIQDAKEESISVIFDALDLREDENHRKSGKKKLPENKGPAGEEIFTRRVVVAGCLSQRYCHDLAHDIPEIDFLYGVVDDGFVPALCRSLNIQYNNNIIEPPRIALLPGLAYSYIKISEGCSNNCSYCAIPMIRGAHRSYDPAQVIREARHAVGAGAVELDVIAQDIASYNWEKTRLPELVDMISEIDGVRWIRLLYCHPDHCTEGIINLVRNNSKVVPYLDLPFQHVSRNILQSMGRKGDARIYRSLIDRLRNEIPEIRIRSTFMVGYPGETEENFSELLEFIEDAHLDRVGAFTYSPEENTKAALLPGKVSQKVKSNRLGKLMALQQEISGSKLREMIGRELEVLIEERVDETTYIGRTQYDAPEVDGIFYLTGMGVMINSIVRAQVTDAIEYDLFGKLP